MLKEHEEERKKLFDAADLDNDLLLNKDEMVGMLKLVCGETSDSFDEAGYEKCTPALPA